MRILSVLLAALFLSACAALGIPQQQQSFTQVSKVAVVSLLDKQLQILHFGTTTFHNQKREVDVSDWQLDQVVETQAQQLIQADTSLTLVKPASEDDRQKFGQLQQNFWTGERRYANQEAGIQALAQQAQADLIVLIAPAELKDVFFGTNELISGYGIYQRSFLNSRSAINFLAIELRLIDAKTGKQIASVERYASIPRENRDWLELEPLTFSEENQKLTQKQLQKMLPDTLKQGLTELQLIH